MLGRFDSSPPHNSRDKDCFINDVILRLIIFNAVESGDVGKRQLYVWEIVFSYSH